MGCTDSHIFVKYGVGAQFIALLGCLGF